MHRRLVLICGYNSFTVSLDIVYRGRDAFLRYLYIDPKYHNVRLYNGLYSLVALSA